MGSIMSKFKRAAIRERLLPLSFEQEDIEMALSEWFWTGEVRDMKGEYSDDYSDGHVGYQISCELCDQPNLRYVFTIKNRINEAELLVGSECYKDFEEEAYEVTDRKQLDKKIRKAKQRCVNRVKRSETLQYLSKLIPVLNSEMVDNFIRYYQMNGSFEPERLLLILSAFKLGEIEYPPKLFKLSIKRDSEKLQLKMMNRSGIETLWTSMSSSQKDWCKRNLCKKGIV